MSSSLLVPGAAIALAAAAVTGAVSAGSATAAAAAVVGGAAVARAASSVEDGLEKAAIEDEYDYVVVGAGSAGCALAARLSEDPGVTVLLLEAGGSGDCLLSLTPAATQKLQNSKRDWARRTEPQTHSCMAMKEQRSAWPSGKMLGGSSSINYMAWVRGNRADYDHMRDAFGCEGWDYQSVLPYFVRMEDASQSESLAASPYHGTDGPMAVSELRSPHPVSNVWLDACEQAGIPRNPDYNGAEQLGASHCQVNMRRGQRCSTAKGYLHPALGRANLHVRTMAPVSRVLFSAAREATGVSYRRGDGRSGPDRVVHARREVVLCAGAVATPGILLRSGVGPRAHLDEVGVDVVADLPVGENLRDHCMVPLAYNTSMRTLGKRDENLGTVLEYLLHRTGPAASNGLELTSFIRTGLREDLPPGQPDLQVHMAVTAGNDTDFKNFNQAERFNEDMSRFNGITNLPVLLHPKSTGRVFLKSADPAVSPAVDPRYLVEDDDVRVLVEGLKIARRVMEQPAWREAGVEVTRIADTKLEKACPHEPFTDEFYEYMARHVTMTVYHPVGTCAMNGDPGKGVVDPRLRVKGGVSRLRVADASVLPRLVSGNTNAACIMVGEKAADIIRGVQLPAVAGVRK